MKTEYEIKSVDELISIIGEPLDSAKEVERDHLDESMTEFIARSPMVFLSTVDGDGLLDISPKGDAPGFVLVDDEKTLHIPDRPGNKLIYGLKNILANKCVGLIFLVPKTRETLRVKGVAKITKDPELLKRLEAQGKPPLLCTTVTVDTCFFHCGTAMVRSRLWQPDTW